MGCSSAPSPDPLMGQAAKANAETAKEALRWYKDLYTNELLPLQKEQQAMGRSLVDRFIAQMDKQSEFADKQNKYYDQTFKPVEEQMVRDAMGYDSEANIQRRSGIAAANVEQQFSNAQQENARNLSRYGINPNSSAFAQTNERLMREAALGKAGAATGAAFDTMDKGIALRAGAANFGRNMPNTAASYYGGANASGNSAMANSAQMSNTAAQNASVMGQGYNTFFQGMNSAVNASSQDFNARMAGANANAASSGAALQGIGSIIGIAAMMMADGGTVQPRRSALGQIHGPGNGVSDSIHATNVNTGEDVYVSNGERVIPADVVRAKGHEFFDKLVQKYHTPAAQQRRAIGG